MEVETPMMHVIPGGASARPFETHHNALDMPLFLRIAPELYLKRLVVGGFERVFEINRNFRNEGVSTRHNPEFTMIEFYQAYADYKDLMALTENMLEKLALDILGTTDVPYQGEVFSFKGPFKKISMFDAILENNPQFTPENVGDREFLAKFVREELKEEVKPGFGLGKLQTIVLKKQLRLNFVNLPLLLSTQQRLLHLLAVMMIIRTLLIVLSSLLVAVNWQTVLAS